MGRSVSTNVCQVASLPLIRFFFMFCSPSQFPTNGLNFFKSSDTESPRHEGTKYSDGVLFKHFRAFSPLPTITY